MTWPLVDFSTLPPYTRKFDIINGSPDGVQPGYIGWTTPGALTSEPKWRIVKMVYSGSVITDILNMNGSVGFNQVWDDRTATKTSYS